MSDEAKRILDRSLVQQIERLTAALEAAVARAEKAEAERDELRANIAAKGERADAWKRVSEETIKVLSSLTAKRDELRALLERARPHVNFAAWTKDNEFADQAADVSIAIDAALNNGDGGGSA